MVSIKPGNFKKETTYTFDHVCEEGASQEEVFEVGGRPLVDSFLGGYNATIFAYGQTVTGLACHVCDGVWSRARPCSVRVACKIYAPRR